MNSVFDSKQTNLGRKRETEKIHRREGRPEVVPIRDWIERWNQMPAKQPDIRGRLRSSCLLRASVRDSKTMGHEVSVEWRTDAIAPTSWHDAGSSHSTLRRRCVGNAQGHSEDKRSSAVEKLRSALRNRRRKSTRTSCTEVSTKTIAKPFLDLLRNTVAEVRECYQSTMPAQIQSRIPVRRLDA